MTDPKSAEEIRAALQGGIASSPAAKATELDDGERLSAASFRTQASATALQQQLTRSGIPCDVKRDGHSRRYVVRIDVGDREKAGPLVDAFRARHGDPAPKSPNHHDLLILSTMIGCVLGLTISFELGFPGMLPVTFAVTGAGALLGFVADIVVSRAHEDRLRFGIVELFLLMAIIGTLLMLARQLPIWLRVL